MLGLDPGLVVRTASEGAADLIRKAILEGRLLPGARLREERLAAELGISRTPVREALLILQMEGIVEASPNRGAFVRTYDLDEIVDVYETRAHLEAHAAAGAAKRITDEALDGLHASCERYAQLVEQEDTTGIVDENQYFHDTIIEAAGSACLSRVIDLVACVPLMYRSSYWPAYAQVGLYYHQRIERALRARDSQRAQSLMHEHILEAVDILTESLSGESATPAAH